MQGVVLKRARGGLTKAADMVREKGRFGDDMLVHMNPREYKAFQERFGPGTINPDTGLPEFFLGDLFGGAVGDFDWSSALLNGGVGAGLGYLTGGTKGALIGGALGGLSPLLGSGGALGMLGLTDSTPAALKGDFVGPRVPEGFNGGSGSSSGGGLLGGLLGGGSGGGSTLAKALPLLAIASAFGGSKKQAAPTDYTTQTAANRKAQNRPLAQVDFTRTRTPMGGFDPSNYGSGPTRQFFNNNALPPVPLARGGMPGAGGALSKVKPSRYVEGPGTGRSDEVPARLSRGEFVIDAETTSLLGDGSSEAGAKKLDEMRQAVRKHKGAALAKGKFSPNAKHPLAYMGMKK